MRQIFLSPSEIVRRAQAQMEAFKMADRGRKTPVAQQGEPADCVWKKPELGFIKINWDVAIDKEGKKMGVGIVARDHDGQVVAALSTPRCFITDPTTAEAMGVWKVAEFCINMELEQVILEGDALIGDCSGVR